MSPGYPPHELVRQYSPSSCVPDVKVHLSRYATDSAWAREVLEVYEGLEYAGDESARYDYFPSPRPDATLVVYLHGGYWQEMSRREAAFAAVDLVGAGHGFAAVGYGLAPRYSLPAITTMVVGAVQHLIERSRGPLYLVGHSAGAHLVLEALLACTSVAPAITGATLLSGVYDLEPLRRTYVNDALGMDAATARACSPLRRLTGQIPPLIVARGTGDTDEFARQHSELVSVARACGTRVNDLVVPDRNHFDLPFDLGQRGTLLGDAVAVALDPSPGSGSR